MYSLVCTDRLQVLRRSKILIFYVSGVCTGNSKLFTFLGNEFGELLTLFCVDRSIGTQFQRTRDHQKVSAEVSP